MFSESHFIQVVGARGKEGTDRLLATKDSSLLVAVSLEWEGLEKLSQWETAVHVLLGVTLM